jgi:nucleotide-binding universal stress UspA family protein
MFDAILVAIDGADCSTAAVELACKLAKLDGAKLVLINAVDPSKLLMVAGYETPYPVNAIELLRESGRELLDSVKASCEAHGLAVTTVACEGDACDEILRIAQEQQVGLICMGTHGRKGFSHLILGSVAEGVLRKSTVPVLIAK